MINIRKYLAIALAILISLTASAALASECNDGIDNDGDGSCDMYYGDCEDPKVFGGDSGCDSPDDDSEFSPGKMMATKVTRISHPAFTPANIGDSGHSDWSVWNRDHTRIMIYESQVDCTRYANQVPSMCDFQTDGLGYGRRAVWAFIDDLKEMTDDMPVAAHLKLFRAVPGIDDAAFTFPVWSPLVGEEHIVYTVISNASTKYAENAGHVVRVNLNTGSIKNVAFINAVAGKTRCWAWSATNRMYCSNKGQYDWSDAYIIDIANDMKHKITGGRPKSSRQNLCDPRWQEWPAVGHGHSGMSPDRTKWAHDYGHQNENGVYLISSCESGIDEPDFIEDMAWEDSFLDLRDKDNARLIYPHAASHVSWESSEDWFIVDTYESLPMPYRPTLAEQRVMQVDFDGASFKYRTLTSHTTPYYWDDGYLFVNPVSPTCVPDPACEAVHCTSLTCEINNSDYPYCNVSTNKCYNTCYKLLVSGALKKSDPGSEHCAMNYHSGIFPVLRKDGRQVLITSSEGKYALNDFLKCEAKEGTEYACENYEEVSSNWGTANFYLIDLAPVCESYTYSSWGECDENGEQTRSIESRTPEGCQAGYQEELARPCAAANISPAGGCSLIIPKGQ